MCRRETQRSDWGDHGPSPASSCRLGRPTALLFTGLAFVGMAFTKLPLLVVLLTLAPMSIAATAAEGTNP